MATAQLEEGERRRTNLEALDPPRVRAGHLTLVEKMTRSESGLRFVFKVQQGLLFPCCLSFFDWKFGRVVPEERKGDGRPKVDLYRPPRLGLLQAVAEAFRQISKPSHIIHRWAYGGCSAIGVIEPKFCNYPMEVRDKKRRIHDDTSP